MSGGDHVVILTDGTDSLRSDMLFESNAECGQVQVSVDAAELAADFDHAGGAPARRHGPVLPVLQVARVGAAMEVIDSMLFVRRGV
jgi:hypothetical protein